MFLRPFIRTIHTVKSKVILPVDKEKKLFNHLNLEFKYIDKKYIENIVGENYLSLNQYDKIYKLLDNKQTYIINYPLKNKKINIGLGTNLGLSTGLFAINYIYPLIDTNNLCIEADLFCYINLSALGYLFYNATSLNKYDKYKYELNIIVIKNMLKKRIYYEF